ncbi:MAG: hypothetical protein WDN06_13770 [Asticcacaulis sp.]
MLGLAITIYQYEYAHSAELPYGERQHNFMKNENWAALEPDLEAAHAPRRDAFRAGRRLCRHRPYHSGTPGISRRPQPPRLYPGRPLRYRGAVHPGAARLGAGPRFADERPCRQGRGAGPQRTVLHLSRGQLGRCLCPAVPRFRGYRARKDHRPGARPHRGSPLYSPVCANIPCPAL